MLPLSSGRRFDEHAGRKPAVLHSQVCMGCWDVDDNISGELWQADNFFGGKTHFSCLTDLTDFSGGCCTRTRVGGVS